jgi:hypothetical protein
MFIMTRYMRTLFATEAGAKRFAVLAFVPRFESLMLEYE